MAVISYEKILSSEPFRFTVGESKKEFNIHSALLANQSAALERLVHGEWKDSRERHVILDQVDEQTFIRFSEYAYTGDYDRVEDQPKLAKAGSEAMVDTVWESTYEDDWVGSRRKGSKKPRSNIMWDDSPVPGTKRAQLIRRFKSMSSGNYPDAYEKPIGREEKYSEPDILLSHAKVYVFADYFGVSKLVSLSFNKLHRSLDRFGLRNRPTGDVVELLRFCYQSPAPDQLRKLVVLYASCHVEKLWVDEEFRSLLQIYGDLGQSLVGSMLERLD